jgi:1-acyl-sn-glycerol-3-phosphate acyltransferase
MNEPSPTDALSGNARAIRRTPTPGSRLARALRYGVRVPLLLGHLLVDLPLALLLMSPLLGQLRIGGERLEHRAVRWWAAWLARICGFRVRRRGEPLPGATLFVANHVSWADIVVLDSQRVVGFVAKREIAAWPVVGWIAARADTIFHQRGSTESLGGVLHEMLARLRDGHSVAVFPEGRTGNGTAIGPFHARIFLAAVETGAPVQPVALRYGSQGGAQAAVAFQPGEHFMGNVVRVLGDPARPVDVVFCEPILAGQSEGRRGLAELARERIVEAMRG